MTDTIDIDMAQVIQMPERPKSKSKDKGKQRTDSSSNRTPDYFIMEICAAWRQSQDGIFTMGKLLIEAFEELDAAGYKTVLEELKLSRTTASKLRTIADSDVLRAYMHNPPSCWGTLHPLALLEKENKDVLLGGIEDGTINPDFEQKAAWELLEKEKAKNRNRSASQTVHRDNVRNEEERPSGDGWDKHDQVDDQHDSDSFSEELVNEISRLLTPLRPKIENIKRNRAPIRAMVIDALREHIAIANRWIDELSPTTRGATR